MGRAAKSPDRLAQYNAKRDFDRTGEPAGKLGRARRSGLTFLVQKHAASRLHYDLRLEWDGVLLSWAVTKGPSADPAQKRLAVRTEDHPMDYGDFEGTIPKKEYGGGTVMLWDTGVWTPVEDPEKGLKEGKLKFTVQGRRMRGGWTLVRMRGNEKRENWLLIKERDDYADDRADGLTRDHMTSVKTGREMDEIAENAPVKDVDESAEEKSVTRGRARPKFQKPQLATLVSDAPDGDDWIHETKFDGYRCLAALGKGGTALYTRSGKDWTDRFAGLAVAFDAVPCDAALIDGEVMARHVSGSAFSSLQSALSDGAPLVFFAFDLLSLDGRDMRSEPQIERRERLAELLKGLPRDGALRMSEHVQGNGPAVFEKACAAGAEGIISKREDAPYRGRRTRVWRKVKCTRRQEFVIGGYSPSDKKGRLFASLLLGEFGEDGLRYRGRVGTGFDESALQRINNKMTLRKTSPFTEVPRDIARGAKWVRADLVAEIDFTELTADGHVRHASFLGLRDDKEAASVTLEVPMSEIEKDGSKGKVDVAGVAISSGTREVFPKAGCTKLDLARYYERAGERLTHIAGERPLSLFRCPEGISGDCFFQKHGGRGFPDELGRVDVEEKSGGKEEYLYARNTKSFVAAAQMSTIEFHIWGARIDRLERPDRIVFDLDPDEGLKWGDLQSAAVDVRDRLAHLGLASVPVVTGGKGVHVCVLLRRTRSWDTVKLFSKTVAHAMAEAEPKRFVATMSRAKRKGRIFIDWLRNERGATAIAPYSVRAREGAPVAVPVTWDELAKLKSANAFTMKDMTARLQRECPYLAQRGNLQSITDGTLDKLRDFIGE